MVFDGLQSTFDGLHMVAAGVARQPRARHLARGSGRVGLPLAAARRRRAGRRALRRRDRRRRRRHGRRERPARLVAREARLPAAGLRSRGDDDRRQRARGQRRRLVRRRLLGGVRGAPRLEPLATILVATATSPTTSPISPARRPNAAAAALAEGREDDRRRRSGSRSTRRSRRSPRTRRGCSASTRTIVNVNGGAVALGHPIGASGGRIVGDDGARAAPERRRPRRRRDLLRRRAGRRAAGRGLRLLVLIGVVVALAAPATAWGVELLSPVRDGEARRGGRRVRRPRRLRARRWRDCDAFDYGFAVDHVVKGTLGARVTSAGGEARRHRRPGGHGRHRGRPSACSPDRRRPPLDELLPPGRPRLADGRRRRAEGRADQARDRHRHPRARARVLVPAAEAAARGAGALTLGRPGRSDGA